MKNPKVLLDKYFEGETSLEEEAQLRRYFQETEKLPPHLEPYGALFAYFESPIPAFSQKGEDKLRQALQEKQRSQAAKVRPLNRLSSLRPWLAAASIALVLSLGFWWANSDSQRATGAMAAHSAEEETIDWSKYEAESPEVAYQNMAEAFKLVSRKMDEGKKQALRGIKELNEAKEQVR